MDMLTESPLNLKKRIKVASVHDFVDRQRIDNSSRKLRTNRGLTDIHNIVEKFLFYCRSMSVWKCF